MLTLFADDWDIPNGAKLSLWMEHNPALFSGLPVPEKPPFQTQGSVRMRAVLGKALFGAQWPVRMRAVPESAHFRHGGR